MSETLLVGIHAFLAAFVNHALGIAEGDIFALHTQRDVVLGAGYAGSSRTVDHDLDVLHALTDQLQRIHDGRAGDDCGPVLVIVEDRDLHGLLQRLLDIETLGRLDVFEIDAAKGRFEKLASADDFVRILGVQLDVKHVNVGEAFEQNTLAFHDGLAGERADVAESELCLPVRSQSNQVALGGVLVSVLRVLFDFETRIGNARRVRQAQSALGQARLGGYDLDLSRPGSLVVVECVLFGDGHDGLRYERCGRVGAEQMLDGGTAVAAYDGATGEYRTSCSSG